MNNTVGDKQVHTTNAGEKKVYFAVALLVVLAIICIVNMIILIVVFSVLQIKSSGMESMAFFKDHEHIKWLLDADFENIVINDEIVGGFADRNVEFIGDNQNLTFSVDSLLESLLSVTPDGTFIKTQNFKFVNPKTKRTILDINGGEHLSAVGEFEGKSMTINSIKTPRIVSDHTHDLILSSLFGNINITGNEGLYVDAMNITIDSNQDLFIRVSDEASSLELSGANGGVKINPLKLQNTKHNNALVSGVDRYRLCACLETGELYRANITSDSITCAIALENPC
ncbi:uncharacterized protein LOC130654228 [Hydractinia symbiolongicarpus]|uniref:uncharacterized protein LOC130654228 n=1 Tax=Hydractinia symbiolongicarpus TaxID=13093 RepID=UPI00254EC9DD|nr:uncharacterized protein LOC130654228 [Hydractinia symbiolongicarpus]